jgi:hypothetical protein
LNDYKLLSYITKEIDKLRGDQESFLAGGGAKSFDEYRHVCGVIRGLTHAETIVKDLVQRMEQSDE